MIYIYSDLHTYDLHIYVDLHIRRNDDKEETRNDIER